MKRAQARAWAGGAASLLLSAASCNAFTGVGDVEFEPEGSTATTAGIGGTGASTGQGGAGGAGLSGGAGGGAAEDGSPCVIDASCMSGSCVDGVCCDSPCAGVCRACVAIKTGAPDGACAAVATGTDPDVECAGAETCCGGACGSCGGEDCTNGADDDLDGDVDCADDQCGAFACVPALPPTADALALYWLGAGPPPACPNPYPTGVSGGVGVNAPPATCGACSCDPEAGASCGASTITFYGGGSCAGGSNMFVAQPGSCVALPGLQGIDSAAATPVPVVAGACAEVGGGVTNQVPWSWQTDAAICQGSAATGAGCVAGEVCAPKPAAPFEARVCVIESGGACSAPYGELVTIHTSVDDQRGCTGCSCGAPAGTACSGQTTLYEQSGCINAKGVFPNDGSCDDQASFGNIKSLQVTAVPTPGTCASSGGSPSGAAVPAAPQTLCCATVP